MRFKASVRLLFASAAIGNVSRAQVVQLQWSTDAAAHDVTSDYDVRHDLGSDGPWQAITIGVGSTELGGMNSARFQKSLWPSRSQTTYIVTNTSTGVNAIDDSPSAKELRIYGEQPPDWSVYNTTSKAYGYYESILLPPLSSNDIVVNASILVLNESIFTEADGRNVSNQVGILGLGSKSMNAPGGNPLETHPSILDQLKSFGNISSRSFGMHMGSVQHKQSGSLVLGGYEQNRALGEPGIFKIDDSGLLNMFLVDVILGTQTGISPFNQSTIISVYQGIGDHPEAAETVKLLGGTAGSILVEPSPSVPYIYLPPGTCETASQYLPVFWNETLELYLWNETDPQFQVIVDSPAYLGVVLADANGRNLTVKVLFQLLKLTLSSPLVDEPRPYFPCKPLSSGDVQVPILTWPLGRAFLQAAFYGVNHDTQTVFMAQGPGPNMGVRVMKTIDPADQSISTDSIDLFEKSWSPYWHIISPPYQDSDRSISTGAIAGIAVGSAVGGLGILAATILLWRRKKKQAESSIQLETSHHLLAKPEPTQELDALIASREQKSLVPHELSAPNIVHEAPGKFDQGGVFYELPANSLSATLHTDGAKDSSHS